MGKLNRFIKGGKKKKSYSVDSDGPPSSPVSPQPENGQLHVYFIGLTDRYIHTQYKNIY